MYSAILQNIQGDFLSDPGIPGVRSMGPSVCHSLTNYTLLIQVIQVIQVTQVIQVIQVMQVAG